MKYTIEIEEVEEKALRASMESTQDWLNHAIKNKARKCINRIIEENTGFQAAKLTDQEKSDLITELNPAPFSPPTIDLPL